MEAKNELQRNAITEARRKELETYQRALDIQWLNSRMEDGRMGRCLALIQKEAEMEKEFQERTDHAAIVNARAEKEKNLAIEIAKVKREEACELLRRHYLRERDPRLRSLIQKLQAGYVCRDLKQQILRNEYKKLQEKVEDNHSNNVLLNSLYNDKDAMEREQRQKMENNAQYCKELQQQLVNRYKQKQCQYEDTLIEKKMLEDIMRTIADEDQRELEKKRSETEKLRNEMVMFKQARDAWKEKQKKMVITEERRIEEQKKASADRNSAIIAERERKMRMKEELNHRITEKILADEASRLDRESIIKLLQEQEYLEKNVQDDIAVREKMKRVKRETKEALTSQMENRKRVVEEQKRRDAEYRREAETKMAAVEQKEREKAQKIKEKSRKYSEELLKQIEDNSKKRKKEQALEEERAAYVWSYHDAWGEEVKKERKNIITEHVPQLLGYLQAGVIKTEDLPAVREGANAKEELSKLDIESMAISNRPHRYSKCNAQCSILREF